MNKYFIDMIEGAKDSEACLDYYNKIHTTFQLEDYDNSIASSLFGEYENRPIGDKKTAIVFCYDIYILHAWFNGYGDLFEQVFVILPDVDFAYTLSKMPEFELLFKHDSFKPIAFRNERFLTNSIVANMAYFKVASNGVMLYKYEAFDCLYDNINEILSCVYDYFEYEIVDINTSREHGVATLENEIATLNMFGKYPYTDVLYNAHKDKPIICVAAGRSLQDDLELLNKIQDEVYIIACSAVVKPLLKAGIKPDLVTVLDMSDKITGYLDGIDDDLTVVVGSSANKNTWKQGFNYIIAPYVYSTESYHYNILKDNGLEIDTSKCIGGCLTVAFMSIQIANIMGANKIILLGQDLCYTDNITHIDGAEYCTDLRDGKYLKIETIDGREALMDDQFQIYHSYLEKKINELRLDIINCSKGVRLENTTEMSLINVYNEFLIGNEYKDIDLTLKTRLRPFKHALRRYWTKLKAKCEKMLENNLIDVSLIDKNIVKYVRSIHVGIDRCFDDKGVDDELLLYMIIDVANKYIKGVK